MRARDLMITAMAGLLLAGTAACDSSDGDEPNGETTATSPSPDELSRDEAVTAAKAAVRQAVAITHQAERAGVVDRAAFEEAMGDPLLTRLLKTQRLLSKEGNVLRGEYRIVSMEPIGVAPSLGEVRLRVCEDGRRARYINKETGENVLEEGNPGFFVATEVVRLHGDRWTVDDWIDVDRGRDKC